MMCCNTGEPGKLCPSKKTVTKDHRLYKVTPVQCPEWKSRRGAVRMWAEGIGKSQLGAIVIAQLRVFAEDASSVPSNHAGRLRPANIIPVPGDLRAPFLPLRTPAYMLAYTQRNMHA